MASGWQTPPFMTGNPAKFMYSLSITRWFFVTALALSTACTTLTPLQTASTVKPGVWRLGAQGSVSPACSVTDPVGYLRLFGPGEPPFADCMISPQGLPTPELRGHLRRGLNDVTDLGVSVHGSAVFPVGIQVGTTLDVRRQLWSRALTGTDRRQLLTVGPQAGLAVVGVSSSRSSTLRPEFQTDLTLPMYFGHQLDTFELVASPRYTARLNVTRGTNGLNTFDTGYLGLSLSAHSRSKLQLAFGVDYYAPTGMLAGGLFTVSLGIAYDLLPER